MLKQAIFTGDIMVQKVLRRKICPACNHRYTRYRIRTNEFVCLQCGCVFPDLEAQADRVNKVNIF